MKHLRCYLVIMLFMPSLLLASNQKSNIRIDFSKAGKFDGKSMQYNLQAQLRLFESQSLDQGTLSASFSIPSPSTSNIWLGYSLIIDPDNSYKNYKFEHRLWQYISWPLIKSENVTLTTRSRFEQRIKPHHSEVAYRARQRITLKLNPIMNTQLTPIFSNEIYINLNKPDWVSSRSLDRNSAFIGLEFPLAKHFRITTGYINNVRFRDSNTIEHSFRLSIKLSE